MTFRAPLARASTRQRSAALLGLLSVLVAANVQWLRQHPKTPHPYSVPGLRYVREAPGSEEWRGIEQILKHRSGDCEDLASYLCAWLIAHEHRAAIRLVWRTFDELGEDGRTIWHVQVRRTVTDEVMDPSKRLGMEGDA